ncbi:hypothetical protein [Pseudoalteromonas sp. SG43-5]|uniref:aldose epimerase family protein n=1 Tax=Pseudoalteromonas sp. SG43-5 TaxID=2760968 RepID=UPI002873ACE9|nr:hypothetical protein [Pseudoalteromonas sp. SG43-5]
MAGPTSHSYFNLNGINNSAQGHILKLAAAHYTPINSQAIPAGLIALVANTTFDYKNASVLNKLMLNVLSNYPAILLSCYPAIQVYTGHRLQSPFNQFDGIYLEPQFSPNSPNNLNFPFAYLTPETPLQTLINYCFTTL